MPVITTTPYKQIAATSQISLFDTTFRSSVTAHQVDIPDVTVGVLHVAFINVWHTSGGYGGITLPTGTHFYDSAIGNGRLQLFLGGGTYIGSFIIARVAQTGDGSTFQFLTNNAANSLTYVVTMENHSVAHTLGKPNAGQIVTRLFGLTTSEPLVTLPEVTSSVESEIVRHAWKYNDNSTNTGYPPAGHDAIDSLVNLSNGGSYLLSRLQDVSVGTKPQVTFTTNTNSVSTGGSVAIPR